MFDSNCNSWCTRRSRKTAGSVTVQWNAPTAGTYFISIKFSSQSLAGNPAPSPGTTVHYNFSTTGVPGSTSGLDLIKN